jgi:hypothetical protein
LDKRLGIASLFLSVPAMAPRISKVKTPAKNTLTAATASAATAAASSAQYTGDFYDLYNDLLAAKTDLVDSAPGPGRKRAMEELGKGLVSLFAELSISLSLFF